MQGCKRWGVAGVLWVMLSVAGYGQYAMQTVTLTKGWNAVYLQVEPADPSCEEVFGDWPVTSVSLYNMEQSVARFTESPDEPVNIADEFLTWTPGVPAGVNGFNAVLAGHSYLMFASVGCTRNLTGRPAVPRIEWIPGTNACNLVGFRQNGNAKFGTYLAGAGFNWTKLAVYTVSGTNSIRLATERVGGLTGESLNTALIVPGKAYFIVCDKVSEFSGPVKVSPAGTGGIYFPSNSVYQTLRLKNENGAPLSVTLSMTNSATAPSGGVPVLPVLHVFDYLEGWLPLTNAVQRTLADGEEWTFPLAVDRTDMIADQPYGGLLVCTDAAGGRVEIPLEAEHGPAHALWPAGLWVGQASLNQVSQVLADGTVVADARAGGTLEFRLILHVDAEKRCRLLQRVIVAGAEETNGTWNASLYVDEAKVPVGVKSARLSSVAFGLKNNDITWDEAYYGAQSGFGKNLRFTYAIAADDPVNPFRHPCHPDHDGLDARFETKLPTGDNPQNYIGAIKPELFSVSNTVTLAWTNAPAAGSGSVLWNPSEKVTGKLEFQVDGLRREGAILMKGAFELRRISQVGALSLE